MSKEIEEKVEKLIGPALAEIGLDVTDIEYRRESAGMVLRVFIERISPAGTKVTLGDCAQASEKIGFLLDKEDIIQGHYSLEVSSPGLYRRLKKEKDFVRFAGEKVKVTLFNPIPMSNEPKAVLQRHFTGILRKCENGKIYIEIEFQHAPKVYEIEMSNVAGASLEPEIKI